jgi:hypothetical protein
MAASADKDKAKAYDRHTQALVKLGYFARSREFPLRGTWADDPAESSRREEERAHAGSVAGLEWHMFQMQRGLSNTMRLTVIAQPQYLAGWEKLLRECESITNK